MATPISNVPGVSQAGNQSRPAAVDESGRSAPTTAAEQRSQLNAQIVQSSLDVSISSGNDGLALLYRSAIEHLNEQLAPELGPNAIQNAMGQDNSPEGTAGRILSQTLAFFDGYARQHPNKDPEQLLHDFVDTIRGGFEKGYAEAAKILEGLGVMGEGSHVAQEIGKTYELVQQGYDDFLQSRLEALRGDASEVAEQPES
ncbi:MAG: DUF5610 domain-containing protein [Gammaproteobacteria bacterium]|nr:DUF5610 domain-containing protein [Gammaproteobacteria bacterium]